MPATETSDLPAGFYHDRRGVLHVDVGTWLRVNGFADTPSNREAVAVTVLRVVADSRPDAEFIQH